MKFKKIVFLLLFMVFIPVVTAGSFSVSSTDLTPNVGDSIKITVKTNDAAGYFKVSSSDSSVLSGGGTTDFLDNSSASFTFSAKKAGNVTITITPKDCAGYDEKEITSSKTVSITVKNPSNGGGSSNNGGSNSKPVIKSSINYLSSLSISGGELSPAFDKNTTEYDVTLEAGTNSVTVSGTKESSVSYVTGLGDINVSDGVNFISVVVTAENGATRTYNIRATVLEKDPIVVNVSDKNLTLIRKKDALPSASDYYVVDSVKINDEDIPAYVSEITGYTLVALKDEVGNTSLYRYDSENNSYSSYNEFGFNSIRISLLDTDVPKGYSLGSITIGEKEYSAYLKDGDYPLLYGINLETGEKNFYSYDSSENTIQKYVMSDKDDFSKYFPYLIIGLCGLVLFEFFVIIGVVISKNKKLKKVLRKKLDTKTDYEKSFDSKKNTVYKDESNITDDLTDEYMSTDDDNLGHTALISKSVSNVYNNTKNKKELKKEKKALGKNRKKNKKNDDDEMFHF